MRQLLDLTTRSSALNSTHHQQRTQLPTLFTNNSTWRRQIGPNSTTPSKILYLMHSSKYNNTFTTYRTLALKRLPQSYATLISRQLRRLFPSSDPVQDPKHGGMMTWSTKDNKCTTKSAVGRPLEVIGTAGHFSNLGTHTSIQFDKPSKQTGGHSYPPQRERTFLQPTNTPNPDE